MSINSNNLTKDRAKRFYNFIKTFFTSCRHLSLKAFIMVIGDINNSKASNNKEVFGILSILDHQKMYETLHLQIHQISTPKIHMTSNSAVKLVMENIIDGIHLQ